MAKHVLFDVRVAIAIVTLWSCIVAFLMFSLGLFDSPFFRFGPSRTVTFFSKPVDTWPKWTAIVLYTVMQQIVQTYGLETITPWTLTVLQNRNVKRMRETPTTAMSVVGLWYVYMWISRVVSIQILLSQIDFLLVVLVVDVSTALTVTKLFYLKQKEPHVSTADYDALEAQTQPIIQHR